MKLKQKSENVKHLSEFQSFRIGTDKFTTGVAQPRGRKTLALSPILGAIFNLNYQELKPFGVNTQRN